MAKKKKAAKTYAQKIHQWWLKQNRMIRRLQAEGYKGLELIPEPKYYESRKRNYESFKKQYSTKAIKKNAYLPMISGTGKIDLKNWYDVQKIRRRQGDMQSRRLADDVVYEPLNETLYNNYMARLGYYTFNPAMARVFEAIKNDPKVKDAVIRALQGQNAYGKTLGGGGLPDLELKGSYDEAAQYATDVEAFLSQNVADYEPVLDEGMPEDVEEPSDE